MPRVFQGWGPAIRTTVTLNDAHLARAEQRCGGLERSALLKEAQWALVQRDRAKRLAALGGSEPALEPIPRRQKCGVILVDTSGWAAERRGAAPSLGGQRCRSAAADRAGATDGPRNRLMDAHLLASARLSHCRLGTQERRLAAVAAEQGLAMSEAHPE